MFLAKCIQDGRRVDLPLSRPFFKLMCTPGRKDIVSGQSEESSDEGDISPTPQNHPIFDQRTDTMNDDADKESNRTFDQPTNSNQRLADTYGASRQRAQLGEAGGGKAAELLATQIDEISKDGSPKDEVTLEQLSSLGGGGAWFDSILKKEDYLEVNPYRGRFIKQLDVLVEQRDAILENENLDSLERERQLADVTLPGLEENIPGARLEDLW